MGVWCPSWEAIESRIVAEQLGLGTKAFACSVLSETTYKTLVSSAPAFRRYLELWAKKHPEIFPPEMNAGFRFHDARSLTKVGLEEASNSTAGDCVSVPTATGLRNALDGGSN